MVSRKFIRNEFRIVRRKSEIRQSDQIVIVITQSTEYCQVIKSFFNL